MGYEEILFSAEGSVGYLTLNNPSKINVLSKKMIGEMIHLLTAVSLDESIKVIVIRATGKHFCAGHDLSEMQGQGGEEYKFVFDQCTQSMQLIHAIPQPVISQVQGVATTAGCQIVAWCDLAVAEEGARFATQGFYAQIGYPDAPAMNYAKHTIAINLMAEDAQNGIAAFIEKKTLVWKNL